MQEESQTAQSNTGLIYGLNDRPLYERPFLLPYSICLLFCSHHHSASYHRWSIKTGFGNHQFPSIHVSLCLRYFYLYPMQTDRRHRHRSLMYPRNQFSFIGPIISAGMLGGLPLIFGTCIVASSVEMVISRILKYTRKIITPLVSGIVVTLIGMSLIKVGITACGGGVSAQSNGTFGSFENLGLALLVLILIILLIEVPTATYV